MNKNILETIIIETVRALYALFQLLLARWLLELSSFSSDWHMMKTWKIWDILRLIHWYRGREFLHQIRGRRVLSGLF